MSNKEDVGLFIPPEVLRDKKLLLSDKMIYAEILQLNSNGKCTATNQHFADRFGMSRPNVTRIFGKLLALKYITTDIVRAGEKIIRRTTKPLMVSPVTTPLIGASKRGVNGQPSDHTQRPETAIVDLTAKINGNHSMQRSNSTKQHTTSVANTSFSFILKDSTSWTLPQAKFDEYQTTYPKMDIGIQFRKAAQWLQDNPAKRKTAKGMTRFLGGWLGRAKPDVAEPECATAPMDDDKAEEFEEMIRREEEAELQRSVQ